MTQAAYMMPDLRLFQDLAVAYKNDVTGDVAPRLVMQNRAVQCCVTNMLHGPVAAQPKPRLVYVQGHTHTPILKALSVQEHRTSPPPAPPPPKVPGKDKGWW